MLGNLSDPGEVTLTKVRSNPILAPGPQWRIEEWPENLRNGRATWSLLVTVWSLFFVLAVWDIFGVRDVVIVWS